MFGPDIRHARQPRLAGINLPAIAVVVAVWAFGLTGCFVDPKLCTDDSECFQNEYCYIAPDETTGVCAPVNEGSGETGRPDTGEPDGSLDTSTPDDTGMPDGTGDTRGDTGTDVPIDTGEPSDSGDTGLDTCQPAETGEICDGVDNDCDGKVDEDFPKLGEACDGPDDDKCKQGKFECSEDNSTVVCVGDEGSPAEEICDGTDNDCDGRIDEDFPKLGEACDGPDDDMCKQGKFECAQDGPGVMCAGDGGMPSEEVCDGTDNDCDGDVDEGLRVDVWADNDGDGKGKPGTKTQKCPGSYSDFARNDDDNCDDDPDNWTADGCMNCTDQDMDGHHVGCDRYDQKYSGPDCDDDDASIYPGAPELCDAKDNDCDGKTDEQVTRSCGLAEGACTIGTQTCNSGSWGSCSGTLPSREVCDDNKDNDCDGVVDDGCPCDYKSHSDGVCRDSRIDATGTCAEPADFESTTDTENNCDGLDNDCDGVVDEGCSCDYRQKPDGVCKDQTIDKTGSCPEPNDYKSDETSCDGLDNDCNGQIDGGGVCHFRQSVATSNRDRIYDAAVDANGNVIVVGMTRGPLGQSSVGDRDAFVASYDREGQQNWVHQFGSSGNRAWAYGVDVAPSGTIAVVGRTTGKLQNAQFERKKDDAFVVTLNSQGSPTEHLQFGTDDEDVARDVTVFTHQNTEWIAVGGSSKETMGGATHADKYDAFVIFAKLGNLQNYNARTNAFMTGTNGEERGLAVDATGNHIYLAGWTDGPLGANISETDSREGFVTKLTWNGSNSSNNGVDWNHNIGSDNDNQDEAHAVEVAGGHVYVGGRTDGHFGNNNDAGNRDGWVAQFDHNPTSGSAPNRNWVQIFGTSDNDSVRSLAGHPAGGVTAAGWTKGSIPGYPDPGGRDVFWVRYDASATLAGLDVWGDDKDEELRAHVPTEGPDFFFVGTARDNDDGFIFRR